jgi:hypothetical protein
MEMVGDDSGQKKKKNNPVASREVTAATVK